MSENLTIGSNSAVSVEPKRSNKSGQHPHHVLKQNQIEKFGPGSYCDGDGLYLVVDASGARRWIHRITIKGKRCDLGLGNARHVEVKDARIAVHENLKKIRNGEDPRSVKQIEREQGTTPAKIAKKKVPTLEQLSKDVHKTQSAGFTSQQHSDEWIASLENHVFKVKLEDGRLFGSLPVDQVTPAHIAAVLNPIWITKRETASRILQRLTAVFDTCIPLGYRSDNPMAAIRTLLPKVKKSKEHYPSLPWKQLHPFMDDLRQYPGISARLAFEAMVLTAKRSGEVYPAKKPEFDFENNIWTIPEARLKIKGRGDHKEPITPQFRAVLEQALQISDGGEYMFPGYALGKHWSNMVYLTVLDSMKNEDGGARWTDPHQKDENGKPKAIVPHGFRSTFKDWSEEKSGTASKVIEACMIHVVADNQTEGAYLRSTFFDERRTHMEKWANFVTAQSATILTFAQRA